MTHQIFTAGSLPEQIKLIQQCGTPVATRRCDQYHIQLYALGKILIEVWYTRQWFWKKAVSVRSGSASDSFLEPYLNRIQLKLDATA